MSKHKHSWIKLPNSIIKCKTCGKVSINDKFATKQQKAKGRFGKPKNKK